MADRKITRIEPLNKLPEMQKIVLHKKVAAYVRVSTESDEQLGSFVAQTDYFYKYIAANPNWEFVGIYSDEGISGTNTRAREGFNNMVADALDGKIDLIITKSLSRFARNTVDALKTIRALKEKNVEVYFEKEDIYTLDSKGELLITLMSSLAQEESRSLSENVTWGRRKRFADGIYHIAYKNLLGYKPGKNGEPEIDKNEAKIVRFIFLRFLEGWTVGDVMRKLTAASIRTAHNNSEWHESVIKSILSNEKYYGAALLQKKYTVDYLTKKRVKNTGVLPQYLVENGHPAIISKELYDEVQEKMNFDVRPISKDTSFNAKLFCEVCGKIYGRRKWTRADATYSYVWECSEKFKNQIPKCHTPHIYEDYLYEAYSELIKYLLNQYKGTLMNHLQNLAGITNKKVLSAEFDTFIRHSTIDDLYDKNTWIIMVRKAVVTKKRTIEFELIDGNKFTYCIPKSVPKMKIPSGGKRTPPKKPKPPKKNDEETYDDLTDDLYSNIAILKLRGKGYKRIAAILNINQNTAKSVIQRNRKNPLFWEIDGYCVQCGSKIEQEPGTKKKRFCCASCRNKWSNAHKNERKNTTQYTHICKYCGRLFAIYGRKNQKYCSRQCYDNARKNNIPGADEDSYTEEVTLMGRGKISDDVKKLIAFYKQQGYGYKRISKITGLSLGSVKSFLYRHRNDPFYNPPSNACKQCGKPILQTPHKREKKFCSDECRMAWWRVHNKAINKKAFYEFVCQQCGQPFEAYGNKNRMYCSRKCYAEARKKKPQEE